MQCRTIYFFRKKWQFYLIDYCYFVNFNCAAFLVLFPNNLKYQVCLQETRTTSRAQRHEAKARVVLCE